MTIIELRYLHGTNGASLNSRAYFLGMLKGQSFGPYGAAGGQGLQITIESVESSGEDVNVALNNVFAPNGPGRMKLILIHTSQFDAKNEKHRLSADRALKLNGVYLVFVGAAGLEVDGFTGHPRVSRSIDLFNRQNNDLSAFGKELWRIVADIQRVRVNGQ